MNQNNAASDPDYQWDMDTYFLELILKLLEDRDNLTEEEVEYLEAMNEKYGIKC